MTVTPGSARERGARCAAGIADALAAGDGRETLDDLSRRVRRAVPFDAAFWSVTDPLTGLATSPAVIDNIDARYCAAYWDREFLAGDYIPFAELARAPRPVATLAGATGGRPDRSGRYRVVLRPSGLEGELRVAFVRGGRTWGVGALYRERGRPGFSEDEVGALHELAPAVADGLRRRTLAQAPAVPGVPATPGMIVFDDRGRVRLMNDAAEEWLRLLPPGPYEPADAPRPRLNTEVLTVVHRARGGGARRRAADAAGPAVAEVAESARRGAAQGGEGEARVRMRAPNGLWLVVHGSALSGPAGEGEVAVVIEAAKGSEMAPIIAEALSLTPREQDITTAVARGEATGEIAARLHLSPHTVRDHLKTIFEKAGVSSRGELVARLFADHYLPRMTGGAHRSA